MKSFTSIWLKTLDIWMSSIANSGSHWCLLIEVMMNEPNLSLVPDVDGPTVLFEHWVAVMRAGRRGPKPAFTPARRKLLAKWFDYYDLPTLLAAIDGCASSDFHMGNNSRGRRYDSLELIFRDAEHIERFASIAMEADDQEVDW